MPFITDKNQLKKYATSQREWQGVPTVEVAPNGTIYVAFFSGGNHEVLGNYVVLVKSTDDGKTWSEPIAAVDVGKNRRAFDPCLWLAPNGKLYFFWSVLPPKIHVEFVTCDNPNADELSWSDISTLPGEIMINKPTVLKSGTWLFPCAAWPQERICGHWLVEKLNRPIGAYTVASYDEGKTFRVLGRANDEFAQIHEPIFLEKPDCLEVYIRTSYGIGKCISYDEGKTWSASTDSGLGGPDSRFFIRRLSSGNILLINHYNFKGRNNLTAMLSRDGGETFEGFLLLDGRNDVAYPNAVEHDGKIYVTYDRERGGYWKLEEKDPSQAKEILMAIITEQDVLAGKPITADCKLQIIVSKIS